MVQLLCVVLGGSVECWGLCLQLQCGTVVFYGDCSGCKEQTHLSTALLCSVCCLPGFSQMAVSSPASATLSSGS